MGSWDNRRKLRVTVLAIAVSLVSLAACFAIMFTRRFTTSWDEHISRYETYLVIDGETLTQRDLERIAALPRLECLILTHCNLAECRLPELTFASDHLRELDLSGTKGLWDLSFLARASATDIRLDDCEGIGDLSVLNTSVLEELHIDGTDVEDLSPLADSPLHILSFRHTKVSDISPLEGMADLWKVDGSYTQVRSVDGLVHAPSLWSMRFDGCPIEKIGVSFDATYYNEIGLAETQIADFGALAGCTGIGTLDLGGCVGLDDISWLDPRNYESLRELDLSRTGLDADDISWVRSCSALTELRLDGIELGDLSLCKGLADLRIMSAVGCGITSARGIERCDELDVLLLGYNQLTDLSALPKPQGDWADLVLDLSHNGLTSLRGLPTGEYRALLLHGNETDLARTMPSGVSALDTTLSWFSGIDDTAFADYQAFGHLYLLDCPADKADDTVGRLGEWRTNVLDEEGLWQLLLDDAMGYGLYVDMGSYVAYAQAQE